MIVNTTLQARTIQGIRVTHYLTKTQQHQYWKMVASVEAGLLAKEKSKRGEKPSSRLDLQVVATIAATTLRL